MSAKRSAKGSAKGAKESKAERERLQKEEDERRLQEEEEARLQAEKEQQERVARERREQEMQRLEAKDQERREDELNEVRHLLEENQTAVKRWLADTREKAKWDRFMLCDGRPDPSQTQEVNTYISLWRDDPEVNAAPTLHQCSVALQLIEALEEEHEEAQEEERQRILDHINRLHDLLHQKHLLIAQEVLNHASSNVDIESGNMETVVRDDHVTLCVWANLNKNPRFKGFQFVEAGLAFELPKLLALSDVALRILHTRYDHLSPHARLSALREQPLSTRPRGEEPSSKPGSPDQGETGGGEGEGVGKEERQSPTHGTEEEVQSVHGSVGRKSAVSVLSERSSSTRPFEEPENQTQTQMEAGVEVPAGPEPEIVDAVAVATVDLHRYTPLGGVFYCDVFRLPPQANPARGWEIRQVLQGGLEALPYPEGSSETQLDSSPRGPEPVGLSLTVPDYVLLLEAPHVACWDPTAKRWTTAGVSGVEYEAAQARVSFQMDSFRAFVLMQETYAMLPLQDWTLQPLGRDSARLSASAALVSLSITVQGHQCMLQVEQEGVLAHLQGRWMGCQALLKAMANAGLNLFVDEHTDRYVRSCGKDPLTEHTLYEQMALLASAAAFSWSQWNARCGGEHMVLQACEHHGPAPVPRGQWSLYLLGAQRSQKLQMSEGSEAFSADLSPDTEFHSTFVHTLRDNLSPEGVAETKNSHFLFVDTVQTLLCATRPLNYC